MIAEHAKCITWVYDLAAGGRQAGRQRKQEEEDLLSINIKFVHENVCPCLCGKNEAQNVLLQIQFYNLLSFEVLHFAFFASTFKSMVLRAIIKRQNKRKKIRSTSFPPHADLSICFLIINLPHWVQISESWKSIYTGIQFQLHKSGLPAERDETASCRAGMDRQRKPHISHQQHKDACSSSWR